MKKLHVVDTDQLRHYGDLNVAVGVILGALLAVVAIEVVLPLLAAYLR